MRRRPNPTAALALPAVAVLAALACAIPGVGEFPPTAGLDTVQTQVALTQTAAAPGESTAVPPTDTPVPPPTAAPPPLGTPTLAPPTLGPPSGQCFVAIGYSTTLLCQNGPDQIEVANTGPIGTIGRVEVSSDGGLVAYSIGTIDGLAELWVVNADGTNARKLADKVNLPPAQPDTFSFPHNFHWQAGTHQIFLDTGFQPTSGVGGPGEYANFDLWRLNADSGDLTEVLAPNSGGYFALSPDGQWLAITRPQDVSLISADGATVMPNLITFTPVITYAEYAYKPDVTWSADSAFFTVNIPSNDPLAADASATLHRVNLDGSTQTLATFDGQFIFGRNLSMSPDGQWAAYITTDSSNVYTLHVGNTTNGAGGSEILTGTASLFGWAPDSLHFAYHIQNDGLYAGTLNVNPQALAPQVRDIKDVTWSDAATVVFSGTINDHWGVRTAAIGGSGAADLAGPFGQDVVFDVR